MTNLRAHVLVTERIDALVDNLGDAIATAVHLKDSIPCDPVIAKTLATEIRNCACAAQVLSDEISGKPKPKVGP